jgi:hypothetical protein
MKRGTAQHPGEPDDPARMYGHAIAEQSPSTSLTLFDFGGRSRRSTKVSQTVSAGRTESAVAEARLVSTKQNF